MAQHSPAMQALAAHGPPSRRWRWIVVVVVVVVAVGTGAFLLGRTTTRSSASGGGTSGASGGTGGTAVPTTVAPAHPLTLVSTTPASRATGVASDSPVQVVFSSPVSLASVHPTLSPPVAGSWALATPTTAVFHATAPLVPAATETLTVPGGPTGVRATDGGRLAAPATVTFTVATGSTLRLQQLLATLNYLPLSFTPSGPAPSPVEQASPQPGSFAWRWPGLPANLTSLWTPGVPDQLTKGAVMTFENQNGLTVDGLPGPSVWSTLLAHATAGTANPAAYNYVLVSKTLPENLTLYSNGNPLFTNILVNTGAPGADTVDGTYQVFEHVTSSRMQGTNPDGTTYDDPAVPWASFFNGGDALHGFVRAHYGFPQSNGCVEMPVATAQTLWPYTPIGTLVTIEG
jgi:peptidoglycan hydrolase-like protein with peptidoglycan-binding domain